MKCDDFASIDEPIRPTPLGNLIGRAALLVDEYDAANEADRKALVARLGVAVNDFLESGEAVA